METTTSHREEIRSYLLQLVSYSRQILDSLPIERTPQPLDYALVKLKTALDKTKQDNVTALKKLERPIKIVDTSAPTLGVGMNSAGMLVDRLTILIIKEWCLRNKANPSTAKADDLYKCQTLDVVEAMVNTRPSNSSLNAKITNIKADTCIANWEDAYYGLFATNLMMWESQEVLYIKDISQLPCEELRGYIKWFSFSNIMRNEYIQHCEKMYWLNK